MLTLSDIKLKKKVEKVSGELPYNFPPEILQGNDEHHYVQVTKTDYGYDIVRRPSWLRNQKTRILHIFNDRRHQKYGVFPEGTNVCIAGWYEDSESCEKIIKNQRDHDHALGLLEQANIAFKKSQDPNKLIFKKKWLDAASSTVNAALAKEEGNNELLSLKKILTGEIELAKASGLIEDIELEETTSTQESLKRELDGGKPDASGNN